MSGRARIAVYLRVYLLALLVLFASAGCRSLEQPSNCRPWTLEHAVLPCAHFADGQVHVRNIRDFVHRSERCIVPRYGEMLINLSEVVTVDLFLCYFDNPQSPFAHSMLSFGTSSGQYLLVSIEARREEGEEYNLRTASSRQLELIYVLAEERDVLVQRAVIRGETVRRYPLNVGRREVRELLIGLLNDANSLHAEPRYYRLFHDNCTSNLVRQADTALGGPLQQTYLAVLPGYADRVLRRLGYIDNSMFIRDQRELTEINSLVRQHQHADDLSQRIRGYEASRGVYIPEAEL